MIDITGNFTVSHNTGTCSTPARIWSEWNDRVIHRWQRVKENATKILNSSTKRKLKPFSRKWCSKSSGLRSPIVCHVSQVGLLWWLLAIQKFSLLEVSYRLLFLIHRTSRRSGQKKDFVACPDAVRANFAGINFSEIDFTWAAAGLAETVTVRLTGAKLIWRQPGVGLFDRERLYRLFSRIWDGLRLFV